MGPAPERGPHVLGQHTDVGTRRALHLGPVDAGTFGDRLDVEAGDVHPPRRAVDLNPLPGQLVQAPSADLHGRDHRRDLLDGAREGRSRLLHLGERHPGHVPLPDDVAGRIEGRRVGTQHDLGHVGLREGRQEPHEAGRPAQPDQQDARRIGVEGAGVADPALTEDPAATRHHVVGGPAGLLVDHHQAGGTHAGGSWSRSRPRRSSSTRDPAAMAGSALNVSRGVRLSVTWAPMRRCRCGPPLLERIGGVGLQRGQVDRGRPHVGGGVDRGHRDHAEALVGVGQPLELLCDDLSQDLVHPQRARVCGGTPFHDDVTSSRSRAPQTSR